MNKQITIIVIATRSIPLADGLDTLLKALPEIEKVETVRTIEQAVQRVEEIKPRVLLLDLALAGKRPEALLEKILLLSPATLRVLLVDDVQDIKWQPQFAEATLVKGVSPSAFATILTSFDDLQSCTPNLNLRDCFLTHHKGHKELKGLTFDGQNSRQSVKFVAARGLKGVLTCLHTI